MHGSQLLNPTGAKGQKSEQQRGEWSSFPAECSLSAGSSERRSTPGWGWGGRSKSPPIFNPGTTSAMPRPLALLPSGSAPNPAPRGAAPLRRWGRGARCCQCQPGTQPPVAQQRGRSPVFLQTTRRAWGGSRLGCVRSPARSATNLSGTEGPRSDRPRRGTRCGGPRAPLIALRALTFPALAPQSVSPRAQPRGSRPPPAAWAMLPRGSG